jgi:hypothetical protein
MGIDPTAPTGLGNLAQSARGKQLNTAWWILVILGGLMTAVDLVVFMTIGAIVDAQFEKEIKELRSKGYQIDMVIVAQEKKKAMAVATPLALGALAISVGVLVSGLAVKTFPIGATATGLILYIGYHALAAFLDPSNLVKGWLLKIVVVVCLVKALQAAIAHQNEERASQQGFTPISGPGASFGGGAPLGGGPFGEGGPASPPGGRGFEEPKF